MRGKRSKQYRKLMQAYSLTFGFRPPYQVLVDAEMIQDTEKFKMDLVGGLERSLGEKVKPMITQCSIRHLYTLKEVSQSQKDALLAVARNMERRRCNHHTLNEPLSTLECLQSVIDPKASLTNKNRYVVASQDEAVRRFCRGVKGVPLVFVRRSVMIMEPMAESSIGVREGLERSKFRSGLKARGTGPLGKRKRADEEDSPDVQREKEANHVAEGDQNGVKKKKAKGPKGPNPLAVKKPKRLDSDVQKTAEESTWIANNPESEADVERSKPVADEVQETPEDSRDLPIKKKRKRKHKTKIADSSAGAATSDNETDK